MAKSTKKADGTRYEVITQEDENGDLILPLPPELLTKLGWKEGDTLDFQVDNQGRYVLTKVN
jgi:hypothetical protein